MILTDKIKTLLDVSLIFDEPEKQEWRRLLLHMTAKEMQEFYQILADEVAEFKKSGIELFSDENLEKQVFSGTDTPTASHGASLESLKQQIGVHHNSGVTPAVSVAEKPAARPEPSKPAATTIAEQIKQKVAEHKSEIQQFRQHHFIPTVPQGSLKTPAAFANPATPQASAAQPRVVNVKSLHHIKTLDDLKRISVSDFRQGSPTEQVHMIKAKIIEMADLNRLLPYHAVKAFEQSPLFKAYLAQGSAKITGGATAANETDALTRTEFEAIADLRKEIERM